MHAGGHCIASEWSWQTALLSSCFLFFPTSWLREKSRVPAELEMDVPVPPLFDFSWLCRVILIIITKPALPSISHLFYVSCFHPLSLVWAYYWAPYLFFPLPILCFHFWPSQGAHNLSLTPGYFLTSFLKWEKKGDDEQSCRKGSSVCFRVMIRFVIIPAEYRESHQISS